MYHLRMIKGRSYTSDAFRATAKYPDIYTEDEQAAIAALNSGHFAKIEDETVTDTPGTEDEAHLDKEDLNKMTVANLTKLAKDMGIDTKDMKKAELIEAISAQSVTPGPETSADYGEED